MFKRLLVAVVLAGMFLTGCEKHDPVAMFGIADEVEAVMDTVVHVRNQGYVQGSGCLISEDGIVFTAKHVTEGSAGPYEVTTNDGKVYSVAKVIEREDFDVAFLLLDTTDKFPCAKMANHNLMRVGDPLFIIGSPAGDINFNSVSLGILASKQRDLRPALGGEDPYGWSVLFQTDSAVYGGNSGGPVFNMKGEVIGVLVAGITPVLNYSVPVNIFMEDLETIRLAFKLMNFSPVVAPEVDYVPDEYMRK